MKVTQTIKYTSLALKKCSKLFKTPRSFYKSDVNNSNDLARFVKVTETIKNTSLDL